MCYRYGWYHFVSAVVLLSLVCLWQVNAQTNEDKLVVIGTEKLADSALSASIVRYYEAERQRDWSTTYKARPSGYQKLVPFETYKKEMEQGIADWKLKKIEILESSQLKNGDTAVKIRFHDEFGPQAAQFYFEGRVTQGVNTRTETTVWKQADSGWQCVDAAGRGHFPLNGRMVYD